jgi:serine/alanine adding enzyme
MSVKVLDLTNFKDIEKWENFNKQNGYLWYSVLWTNVILNTYNFKSIYLYIENKQNEIVSIFPLFYVEFQSLIKELVSLPHIETAGIINTDYFEFYKEYLINNYDFNKLKIFQFNESIKNIQGNNSHSVFILDIPDTEEGVQKLLKRKKRGRFEKLINKEIKIEFGISNDIIEHFIKLMKYRMHKFGTPWHKDNFFYNIIKTFKNDAVIVLGKLNGIDIGAALGIRYGDTMYALYQATIPKFKSTKIGLTLEYNLLNYARNLGLKQYSLGRSPKDTGPYRYKKSLQAKEYPMYIYTFQHNGLELLPLKEKYVGKKYNWATTIVKAVPIPIFDIISGSIRKWVY